MHAPIYPVNILTRIAFLALRVLEKTQRRRQRKCQKTNVFMSIATALHLHHAFSAFL